MAAIPLFVVNNRSTKSFKIRKVLEKLSDFEVQKFTGFDVVGANEIINIYEPLEGSQRSKTDIPLETKVLTFLSQLRSGSFQWILGSSCGISKSSASSIIQDCCNHTLTFGREVICFPNSINGINKLKHDFYLISKVPNVVGIIDGTHVPIKAPSLNEPTYVNRKNYHSINCQVVAGPDYRILDLVAKWPGSSHDSFIWKDSSVRRRLYQGEFGADSIFIGKLLVILKVKLVLT